MSTFLRENSIHFFKPSLILTKSMFELVQLSTNNTAIVGAPVLHDHGELLLVLVGGLLQPPHLGHDGLQLGGDHLWHGWSRLLSWSARSTHTIPVF